MTRSPRKSSGSVLGFVFVVMFILVTIIAALFQMQSVNWAVNHRAAIDLEARQRLRFETLERFRQVKLRTPSWFRADIEVREDTTALLGQDYARDLFLRDQERWTGLPNLVAAKPQTFDASRDAYPGHRYLRLETRLPRSIYVASSQQLPFAAMSLRLYQPNSRVGVDLEALYSWQNPLFRTPDPLGAYAASPPVVVSSGGVQVENMPYGFAFVDDRSDSLVRLRTTESTGGAVAFTFSEENLDALPLISPRLYKEELRGQFEQAIATFGGQAVNKTLLIRDEKINVHESYLLFYSGPLTVPSRLKARLSLAQSQEFWLPLIPGFQKALGGFVYYVVFNFAQVPDGGLGSLAQRTRELLVA